MLDPTYLQNVTKGLETYWYDLETKILCEIAERIKENENHLSATADYLMMQAQIMNVSNDKINKYLSDALNLSVDEVKKIIKESTYMSLKDDNKIFDKAVEEGLMEPYTFNPDNFKKLIEQGVSLTTNEIENICQTTAVTASQKLTKALNSAYMEVSTGTYSSDRAVENAIKQLANEDLSWIDYESGTHRRLDTVIRTAVRTGVNTTAAKCQEQNLDFLDCNLVETTSHLGARPSHAEWQGEIFYRKTPYKSYRNFYTATGYGTAGGLCGINCRHSFYPFIEGISEPTFEKFDSKENNELYELQQQQRYNERKIRSWKRKKEIKDTCDYDTTREKEKIRYWKERNNKLIASNDRLKHNYSREKVVKNNLDQLYKPVTRDRKVTTFSYKKDINIKANRVTSYQDEIYVSNKAKLKPRGLQKIKSSNDEALLKYNIKSKPKIVVFDINEYSQAYGKYDAITNTVYYCSDTSKKDVIEETNVFKHEMWHMKQAENYKKIYGKITDENYIDYIEYSCQRAKKFIDSKGIDEYNVDEISKYAEKMFNLQRYDEVEAEYKALIEGKE